MTRILLHIGPPKTGSTALQSFCAKNREVLFAKGIGYYAPLYRYDPWREESNADFLLVLAARRAGIALKGFYTEVKWENQGMHFEEWLSEETKAFSAYARMVETLILSEEWLWDFGVEHATFWTAVREELEALCPGAVVEVICYLRRQDEWLLSKWKEDMQNEIPVPLDLLESMADYEVKGYFDYEAILRKLEEAFDRERLIVKSFDRRRFPQGSISADFLQTISRAGEDDLRSVVAMGEGYASIPYDVAAALCQRNKRGKGKQKNRFALYRAARAVSARYEVGNRVPDAELAALREMQGRYTEGNRRIAERYADGMPLFPSRELCNMKTESKEKSISLPRLQRRITLVMIYIWLKEKLLQT